MDFAECANDMDCVGEEGAFDTATEEACRPIAESEPLNGELWVHGKTARASNGATALRAPGSNNWEGDLFAYSSEIQGSDWVAVSMLSLFRHESFTLPETLEGLSKAMKIHTRFVDEEASRRNGVYTPYTSQGRGYNLIVAEMEMMCDNF